MAQIDRNVHEEGYVDVNETTVVTGNKWKRTKEAMVWMECR
ncbi:hypothetical protein [Paenactinomyces guangxiensis]